MDTPPSRTDLPAILEVVLRDADFRRVRQAAARLLEAGPGELPLLLEGLAVALKDPEPRVARRAAGLLASLGPRGAPCLPALLEALGSLQWTVREAVVLALGPLAQDSEEALDALLRTLLHDRAAPVRQAAGRVLAGVAERRQTLLAHLRDALEQAPPRLRCRALAAIADQPALAQPLVEAVLRGLGDSHRKVRQRAAETLAELGSPALPAVAPLLRRRTDRDPGVARAAGATLERLRALLAPPRSGWPEILLEGSETSPERALVRLLGQPDIPPEVRSDFHAACLRRLRWQRGLLPGPAREEAGPAGDAPLASLLACAEQVAAAHARRGAGEQLRRAAREQEAGWLTSWLWSRLAVS